MLSIFSIYLIGSLIFKKTIGDFFNQIILGAGIFISVYIILFGSTGYLGWLLIQMSIVVPIYFLSRFLNKKYKTRFFDSLNFYGATILLPYIIIGWIIWQVWNKKLIDKISILIQPVCFFLFGLVMTFRMNNIIDRIENSSNKILRTNTMLNNKVDKYLTELILGALWKYHAKICLYDGLQPPFHYPVLGFAQPILYFGKQLNNQMNLQDRIELYKNTFPEKQTKFDCKCAKHDRLYINRIR